MKEKLLNFILFVFFILIVSQVYAQNPKKLYKSGVEYEKVGNYEKAIEVYSKAIEIDPNYIKAIEARAVAYEKAGDLKNSASDFENLDELVPSNPRYAYKAAELYYKSGEFKKSGELLRSIDETPQLEADILLLKAQCYYELEKYNDALVSANKLIGLKNTAENFFIRGQIYYGMQNFVLAEKDFSTAVSMKPGFTDAMVQKAIALYSLKKTNEAFEVINKALVLEDKNKKAYILKSKIQVQYNQYEDAILTLTKLLSFDQDNSIYLLRANAYKLNSQFPQAINDYSKFIAGDQTNYRAYEGRAECYKIVNKREEAIKDYTRVLALLSSSTNDQELIIKVNANLFELKKESNPPRIIVINVNTEQKTIEVPEGQAKLKLSFKIVDENRIEKLEINGKKVAFNPDSISWAQQIEVNIQHVDNIEFNVSDIYQNQTTAKYSLVRKDTGLPKVVLKSPSADEKGIIYLRTNDPEISIEGLISGQNLVDSVFVNDFEVPINNSVKNPGFKVKINVAGGESLNFRIKDKLGNESNHSFYLDRSDAKLLAENPMGRTWVVFVENSDYRNFSSLTGPKKEVELMIKALSKYKIDKIIHKKNLSKSQMEYFFSRELKDMVIDNRVNSLLIWYAGHGKLSGQDGFWVPVDSKMDDESSYFNINILKNSIKPYVQTVTHSLIVTDACETGPGFYMAMRNIPTEKNCSDNKSTKFKSSQVFSSSGSDLADGDSQFTSSFANSLMFDNNSCVPIERIVNKVSSDVIKSNNKRPKFGKIAGFEDENGTFIFIKK